MLLTDRVDALEDFRQARARDHRVLHDEMRREPAHRAERFLSSLPQSEPPGVVARDLHVARAPIEADALHFGDAGIDSSFQTIELEQEDRFGVARVTGRINGLLDDPNRRSVHELQRGGDNSRSDDCLRNAGGVVDGEKISEQGANRLRTGHEPDRYVERKSEAAFGSDECPAQIVAIPLPDIASELDDIAARKNNRHRQDVVQRHPVLEAVGPTRVLGHIPTNGARDFTGRIGGVEQTVRRDVLVETELHDAGLDCRAAVLDVDRDVLIETVKAEDDDVVGERINRRLDSSTARHERELIPGERSNDGDSFVARSREDRQLRLTSVPGEPVRVVNQQLAGPAQDVSLTNDVGQTLANRCQLHARNLAIHSLAAARNDETDAVALDPVVERGVHSLELAVQSDGSVRAAQVDAAAVDDEAVELRQRCGFFRASGDAGKGDGKEACRPAALDDHHVQSPPASRDTTAECGHLELPLTDTDEDKRRAIRFPGALDLELDVEGAN